MNWTNIVSSLPRDIIALAHDVRRAGGDAWVVGGFVRDAICGRTSKDVDIEITGVSVETLEHLPGWVVSPAGHRFGVWLVRNRRAGADGEMFEVCVPQTRVRTGAGHMGETAIIDTNLGIAQSLSRRDFTMNAMAVHALTGEFIDPFNGQADLASDTLRAVNADNFGDDPVRVLRGMRFCSTHGLTASPETLDACREHVGDAGTIDANRMRNEWVRWAHGVTPHLGIEFLRDSGWLASFPFLADLDGLEQDAIWHPEGDVLTHTIMALQAVHSTDSIVVWAVLLHDIGKAWTTEIIDGRITSRGHAEQGAARVVDFFRSIGFDVSSTPEWMRAVEALVASHMALSSFDGTPSNRAIRRLARSIAPATMRQWATVCMADNMARGEDAGDAPIIGTILDVADASMQMGVVDGFTPILMGRHLIDMGVRPGREMGEILRRAEDAQINGSFTDLDGARNWVVTII